MKQRWRNIIHKISYSH